MKYKLIPKASVINEKSPKEHKQFALMDSNRANYPSIASELQNRHLFLLPEDLLTITKEDKEIYFSTSPYLDKPQDFPIARNRDNIKIPCTHRNSPIGMKVIW